MGWSNGTVPVSHTGRHEFDPELYQTKFIDNFIINFTFHGVHHDWHMAMGGWFCVADTMGE